VCQISRDVSVLHLLWWHPWRRYGMTGHQNTNVQSACLSTLLYAAKTWTARRGCWDPWKLSHKVSALDTRHQMAGPCLECWSHKPDWPFPSNGSDCQASQLYLRSHCQDAEYYSSPPSSALPHRLDTLSNARQIMDPSSGRPYKRWLDQIRKNKYIHCESKNMPLYFCL